MDTFGFKTMECLDSEEGSFGMWGRVGDVGVIREEGLKLNALYDALLLL